MHNINYYHGAWRFLLCSFMVVAAMLTFTSCGDDEPTANVIDYYIEVEEEFLINSSSDLIDRYYNPINMMREAIRTTYPEPNAQGNDEAVIAACEEVYQSYYRIYGSGQYEDHLTCTMHLVRAKLEGKIVRQSERIRTYVIDVNPAEIEE